MTATARHHWSRWVPAAVVAVAAALPLSNLLQAPVRALIIGVGVAALIVAAAGTRDRLRLLRDRRVLWPSLAFLVFGLVAVVTSPRPVLSWFGDVLTTRGLLLYVLLLALALATALQRDLAARPLLYGLTIASAVVSLTIFVQWAGIGLATLRLETLSGLPGTLGNPNFAAGWLGAAFAAPLWVAWEPRHATGIRVAAGVVGLAALLAIVLTAAFQGPVVVAVVVAIMLTAWSTDWDRTRRLVVRGGLVVAVVLGLAGMAAGLADQGPLAGVMNERGIELRQHYWAAAVDMGTDSPLTGVGFDRYGREYRRHRTPEAAGAVSVESFADAAHNVALQFFATGGVPLVAAYLALVVLVAVAAVVAFRRTKVAYDRRVVASVAAVWTGYQAQSMISIDDPALAVLGWVAGGALVGLWAATREGAGAVVTRTASKQRTQQKPRGARKRKGAPRRSGTTRWVGWVAAGVIVIVAAIPAFVEVLSGARAGGTPDQVLARIDRSTGLAPWEPRYPKQDGVLSLDERQGERAAKAFAEADQRAGGDFASMLSLARTKDAIDDKEGAVEAFEAALRLEPSHPQVAAEVAEYFLEEGRPDRAAEIVRDARADHPDFPALVNLRQRLQTES